MRARVLGIVLRGLLITVVTVGGQGAGPAAGQGVAGQTPAGQGLVEGNPSLIAAQNSADPVIKGLVARLELEKYKATIKGLTQFGDRREATQRNRDAVDWIEAQLKSYGYTNTERVLYDPPVGEDRTPGHSPRQPSAL